MNTLMLSRRFSRIKSSIKDRANLVSASRVVVKVKTPDPFANSKSQLLKQRTKDRQLENFKCSCHRICRTKNRIRKWLLRIPGQRDATRAGRNKLPTANGRTSLRAIVKARKVRRIRWASLKVNSCRPTKRQTMKNSQRKHTRRKK